MTQGAPTDEQPDRRRVGDWAYNRLRVLILNHELTPGTRLSVPALAEQLSVSRSPVREAVLRLIREGLADEVPHRGAVVSHISRTDLAVLYEVREVLEGLAARLAAVAVTDEEVSELEENLQEHEAIVASGDLEAHMDADMRFHAVIREASGNPWLTTYLSQIQGQIRLAMTSTSVTAGAEPALHDHQRIFAAVEGGQAAEAEEAGRMHIRRLREALLNDPPLRDDTGPPPAGARR